MSTEYEYLCDGCRARFVSPQSRSEHAPCPECGRPGATLTALILEGRRSLAATSLVAYQGGQRWLGGCCSG